MDKFSYVNSHNVLRHARLRGHLVLARKCEKNESDFIVGASTQQLERHRAENPDLARKAEMVIETMVAHYSINWCVVLAVGPKVGMRRTEKEMDPFRVGRDSRGKHSYRWGTKRPGKHRPIKHYGIPRHVNNPVKPGDFIILPETSIWERMWRGITGSEHELIVDECEIKMIYSPDGVEEQAAA